jgi:hypothetical protein
MRATFLIVAAVAASAAFAAWPQAAKSQPAPAREFIYGAELLTPEEREQYRRDMAAAASSKAQAQVRSQQRERARLRARHRGVELTEPVGVVRK